MQSSFHHKSLNWEKGNNSNNCLYCHINNNYESYSSSILKEKSDVLKNTICEIHRSKADSEQLNNRGKRQAKSLQNKIDEFINILKNYKDLGLSQTKDKNIVQSNNNYSLNKINCCEEDLRKSSSKKEKTIHSLSTIIQEEEYENNFARSLIQNNSVPKNSRSFIKRNINDHLIDFQNKMKFYNENLDEKSTSNLKTEQLIAKMKEEIHYLLTKLEELNKLSKQSEKEAKSSSCSLKLIKRNYKELKKRFIEKQKNNEKTEQLDEPIDFEKFLLPSSKNIENVAIQTEASIPNLINKTSSVALKRYEERSKKVKEEEEKIIKNQKTLYLKEKQLNKLQNQLELQAKKLTLKMENDCILEMKIEELENNSRKINEKHDNERTTLKEEKKLLRKKAQSLKEREDKIKIQGSNLKSKRKMFKVM